MDQTYDPPLHHPHPHPAMAPRRREDEDEIESNMSYLPGSGPSLDIPEYPYDGYPDATPPGFVTAFWNPYEVKHRRRTSRAQLSVLEREFDTDPKPNADKRRSLAAQLNMSPRAIQVWFQNRRAKLKAIKNKIPGGRGMPKLKPGERAAARANRSASGSSPAEDNEDTHGVHPDPWIELSPDESPSSSPGESGFPPPCASAGSGSGSESSKPRFAIAVPPSDVASGPPSPVFPMHPAQSDLLAPPAAAAMLRRGSAPAPLQGIHRARYSVFHNGNHRPAGNELEVGVPPESPISPPDHQVAPLRRASSSHVGLGRRPSLPDSHLRLPAHPYYPHASGPRMQRRGALLSPVPDVGQEQEQQGQGQGQGQYGPLPTMLPPAPAVGSSRMYRALPPGMGAVPAAHDLPTQLPARPGNLGSTSTHWANQAHHTPARPFAVPVAGPLPAADFSFGAPEPGHGDAFNRAMGIDSESAEYPTSEFGPPEFSSSNTDFTHSNNSTSEFASPGEQQHPHMWDARTRFGSMASIASDVTGVSVSSTRATSVSGGIGTNGYGAGECSDGGNSGFNGEHSNAGRFYGYPAGFQPDLRRASCPGEFLHQFSGMGVGTSPPDPSSGPDAAPIAPDSRAMALVHDAKSIRSPTFPPGQVDPTFPPPPPGPSVGGAAGPFASSGHQQRDQEHMSNGQSHMSPTAQQIISPTGMSPVNQQQHMTQTNLSPAQRSLVGGGFGSEQPFAMGYDAHAPPSFEASPNLGGVNVLGDARSGTNMEMMNIGGMAAKASPMLFGGDGAYDMRIHSQSMSMSMIGQDFGMTGGEYAYS